MTTARIALIATDLALRQLETALTAHGYPTIVWPTAKDAHLMLRREQPALVILELGLEAPGSSESILDLLALDPRTQAIPVIVCGAPERGGSSRGCFASAATASSGSQCVWTRSFGDRQHAHRQPCRLRPGTGRLAIGHTVGDRTDDPERHTVPV